MVLAFVLQLMGYLPLCTALISNLFLYPFLTSRAGRSRKGQMLFPVGKCSEGYSLTSSRVTPGPMQPCMSYR